MTPRPFTAFNFAVEIAVPDVADEVCSASFSECDGLEMTMDLKSVREGGNPGTVYRLAGSVAYSQCTLKRGLTDGFDLFNWFDAIVADPTLRADAEVVVLAPDGGERVRYVLSRCLPVKLKAPPLNAKDGTVAIEELQLAYERLSLKPGAGGAGIGIGIGVSISGGIGA
jgi:phage tail-like protein